MSVVKYENEQGQILWKAYACVRSKENRDIRIQKWRFNCESEAEAQRAEKVLFRECERELAARELKGSSWSVVVENWEMFERSNPSMSDQTRIDYYNMLQTYTKGWMHRPAATILTVDVKEVLNQAQAMGREAKFLATLKATIDRVFRYGMDTRMIRGVGHSPGFGIKINQREKRKPEILNEQQIQKLLALAKQKNHPWYHIWAVALFTGLRAGELFALRWSDIDWVNRHLAITKSYSFKLKSEKSTKSGDWRDVPISAQLASVLEELKAITGNTPYVLPRYRDFAKGEQAKVLRMFCKEAGLTSIKFHTLRACFATQMLRSGASSATVMKIGGWKDLETMQIYIRLAGIETSGATDRLNFLVDVTHSAI